jgi:prepilin-type N-terminal cleavage/methylation domain-containing protein
MVTHGSRVDPEGTMCKASHRAFSLVELLVVVAIIALLAGILFPVFASARRSAYRTTAASNLKQIGTGVALYCQDYDELFPRTQETLGPGEPSFISYWSVHYYQASLDPYIRMGKGGVNANGQAGDKSSVWFDPGDPDRNIPVLWGSFCNNGLVSGTSRSLSQITRPAHTVFSTLRTKDWSWFTTRKAVPNPLPVSDPNDPFWQSNFFDICLNPWGANDRAGSSDPFYWPNGKATAPGDLFPKYPHTDLTDGSRWSRGIDGRFFDRYPSDTPRYGAGQLYLFCDGHVAFMPFAQTYRGVNDNMWSTDQETPVTPDTGG